MAAVPSSADLAFPFIDGLSGAVLKMVVPVLIYAGVAVPLWFAFRSMWRAIDEEATEARAERSEAMDRRPAVVFVTVALVLTVQYYYGGRTFFGAYIRPWLRDAEVAAGQAGGGWGSHVDLALYDQLYQYAWWSLTRVVGYVLVPLVIYKLLVREDDLRDLGFRVEGVAKHWWAYAGCLAVMVPVVFLIVQDASFSTYYPFYDFCSRSWVDLLAWELLYVAQFFGLEVFFRGFMLVPLRRSLGTGAIFAMCVPYVMIHFDKPYLETAVAVIAGVVLGTLAMRTKSIYGGFLVHVGVALLMDGTALYLGDGLPDTWWPPEPLPAPPMVPPPL